MRTHTRIRARARILIFASIGHYQLRSWTPTSHHVSAFGLSLRKSKII